MDSRGLFIVGLSIVFGAAVMLVPGLAEFAPASIRFMFHSGVVVGGLAAILLNLVFRLGVSQSARLVLSDAPNEPHPRSPGPQIVDFVQEHGADRGARQDAITRAAHAALADAEATAASGGDPCFTQVRGGFGGIRSDESRVWEGGVCSCNLR